MKELQELNLLTKKYIIFDMDGTLIDSIGIWNITDYRLIKLLGNKEVDLMIIQKERDSFLEQNTGCDIYLEYCNFLIEKYHLNISKEELLKLRWSISSEYLEKDMDFKPNVVELIKTLKEMGFILVLATATTQTQLDIYSNKNEKMYRQMKINEYFDLIIRKEDIVNKKPDPEIYLYILKYYNAKPNECLVFEDSLHGIISAKGAKIETVNIHDIHSDDDRTKINDLTDYKIYSYQEFLDIVVNKSKKYNKKI